jgi:hypothetical protein
MMARAFIVMALALLASSAQARSQNVAALLKDGFTLASTIPTSAGPGLFLVKAEKLFFCVVAETEKSADVATRYCKPVR